MITVFCIRPVGYNIGNGAIYLGLQHLLNNAFGQVVNVITVPATQKYDAHGRAGLSPQMVHEINQYGHGVIVGGGNLLENGELDVSTDALAALDVPLMLFSLSRGRIYNRLGQLTERTDAMPQRTVRALTEAAAYTLVRDDATAKALEAMGCRDVVVGGCPTVFLDKVADGLPRIPDHDRGLALLSVRNPRLMNIPLRKQAEIHGDVTDLVGLLRRKTGGAVRILCHDYRDIPFAASIPDVEYVYTDDIYTYLALLRDAAVTVSYRLHATLPSLTLGTPSIKISYDERALSLMKTLGLESANINLMKLDGRLVDVVEDRFDRLDEQRQTVSSARSVWHKYYNTCSRTFQAFASDVATYYDLVTPPLQSSV